MSQAAVEKALGKLVTDEVFRDRFFTDPVAASFNAGLELSTVELDALSRLPEESLAQFSRWLDDRIRRLPLDGDQALAAVEGLDAKPGRPPAVSRTVIDAAGRGRKRRVGRGMALPETLGQVGGRTTARASLSEAGPTVRVTVHAEEDADEEHDEDCAGRIRSRIVGLGS